MYPAHGRYPLGIKIQEDRKGRMSLNIHQNPYGIRTISKIVIPEDLIECTQQDLIDTMGQIVYAASIGRDILQYSVSDYRDLETAQIRAFAHQAELFHTLNVMAETEQFSLSFNELQQTVMGLYPAGVMSLSPELQPRIIPDLLKRPNVTLN